MSFKEKLKDFIKKYHYTKEETDNKYADKTHTHTGYLTSASLNNYVTTNDSRLSNARTPTSHTHTKSQITDLTIPTKTSDLTNNSGFLTSHQDITGKADITQSITNGDTTHSPSDDAIYDALTGKADITQSITNGDTSHSPSGDAIYDALIGKSDTNHTHSNYVNPTIVDNLTTDDATKTLSAKQGKVLNDRIGVAINYINK